MDTRAAVLALLLAACSVTHPRSTAVAPAAPAVDDASSIAARIGSSRNARPAPVRRPPGATLTYFMQSADAAELEALARSAPGVMVVAGLSSAEALARAAEADGCDASYASEEFVRAAPHLAWVQARSAGVDRYAARADLADASRLVLTNLRAVHGPAIADHAFAMLLALTRDLPVHLAARESGSWKRDGSGAIEPIALQGRTMLVVGLGGIGTEIATRAHGFGMQVIATRRSDEPGPAFVEHVGKPEELLTLLPRADVVAVCVPLTKETERLIDARAFAAMKRGSYLVNIARGRVVDQEALVAALESKHLAGACLDVTDPEPLPASHRLWRFENVVITPHVAARAQLTDERAGALVHENLRRFGAREPLLNVVDPAAGY